MTNVFKHKVHHLVEPGKRKLVIYTVHENIKYFLGDVKLGGRKTFVFSKQVGIFQ